jgi:RNA ligase
MTEVSTKSVWEVLSNGDNMEDLLKDVPDEFYTKIKEYELELKKTYSKIETICVNTFNKFKELERKEYAEEVKWNKYSSVLFSMYNGKDYSPIIWKIIKPEFKKL